jgi:hypothetical protein
MSTERRRLPNRRTSETFELEVAGLRYKVTVNRFPDDARADDCAPRGSKAPRAISARACERERERDCPLRKGAGLIV